MILEEKDLSSHINSTIMHKDILIIPDVHGRSFWKKAVGEHHCEHVVFLGDYLDPYPQEHIENEQAITNFQEIIDYKLNHEETTTLLIGNHDMHYCSELFADLAMGSRYSNRYAMRYKQLFHQHAHLFQLAYEATYDGVRCLLTHAGVSTTWHRRYTTLPAHFSASDLNRLMDIPEGIESLARIGGIRGGWDRAGSILWADWHEIDHDDPLEGWYQIFGHTQQESTPVITTHFACIDCRKAFTLSEVLRMAQDISTNTK